MGKSIYVIHVYVLFHWISIFFLFFYCKFPSQFSRYGVKHWKINQQTHILFNLCLIVNITTHVIQLVIFTYSDFIPCVHDPPPPPTKSKSCEVSGKTSFSCVYMKPSTMKQANSLSHLSICQIYIRFPTQQRFE